MSKLLGTFTGEGFTSSVYEDADGRVHFKADLDVDADGANGQGGAKPAYAVDDKGSDYLANGGMKMSGGRVICAQSWARDIVILGADNQPKVFPGGVVASMTWWRDRRKSRQDPTAYVDSETVPYIVVPPLIIQGVAGIVCGCKAIATYQGKSVACVVADRGPKSKIGEASIACARALGIPSSPRNGGIDSASVFYELWPGAPAVVNGVMYDLIPS